WANLRHPMSALGQKRQGNRFCSWQIAIGPRSNLKARCTRVRIECHNNLPWPVTSSPVRAIFFGSIRKFYSGNNFGNVRFESEADICGAKGLVRFTPDSDRESGLPQTIMSALPPIADMCGATRDVRFGPKADSCR